MTEAVDVTASVSQVGPDFQYDLTLHNVGTTTIGGLWIAWIPGGFFLPSVPIAESAPAGWGAQVVTVGQSSVQFAATSSSAYVQPGGTLSGFSFTTPDAPAVLFPASGMPPLTSFAYDSSAIDPGASDPGEEFVVTAACFAAGTFILTASGEMMVERLGAGDAVPTLGSGRLTPVRWLGHTRIDCGRHPRPEAVWPVRVNPGAFGPGRPARPLLLSPDHAVHAGDALVPIRHLLNGVTIVQQPVDIIEYWHVELPAHAVLLADGLPVESYLNTGNKSKLATLPIQSYSRRPDVTPLFIQK